MDWQILTWSRLADAAAGGLIVLAVGSLAARLCRQPVRRARLIVLTLLGGVAVPCPGRPAGRPSVVGRAPRRRRPRSSLALTMQAPAECRKPTSACPRRPDRESPSSPSSSPERRRRAPPGPTLPSLRQGR